MLQSYNDKKQKSFCEKERGCAGDVKICISPQFWTSDEREVTKGSLGNVKNSHFTTVLGVRRARSDERVVSRRCQPNPPGVKRRKKQHSHSQQPFSAIMLLSSEVGCQLFSSGCCGQGLVVSHSHHLAVVRGWLSAILIMLLWSGVGGVVNYCHIMLLWSGVGGQPFSSCCCGQRLVVNYCHIMLLRSGVGRQLL